MYCKCSTFRLCTLQYRPIEKYFSVRKKWQKVIPNPQTLKKTETQTIKYNSRHAWILLLVWVKYHQALHYYVRKGVPPWKFNFRIFTGLVCLMCRQDEASFCRFFIRNKRFKWNAVKTLLSLTIQTHDICR